MVNITSLDTSLDIDSGMEHLTCEPSIYNILDFENKPLISAATAVGCLCSMPLSHLFWLALAKLRVRFHHQFCAQPAVRNENQNDGVINKSFVI